MPPAPRIHNLPHNRSERTPARCLFWDTETRHEMGERTEVHTLRLWAAELVERRGPTRKAPRPLAWDGRTTAEMCDCVEDACRPSETLWLWAHNLGFDLAVAPLPVALVDRGWEITQHALTGSAPWLRMRRGTRSLTMVDSHSWLPVPLERLGPGAGIEKPPLPGWEAEDAAWLHRCRADVAILKAAVCRLLDWWDTERLGHWSITGPGTGWNSYRHRPGRSTVVIDPDPDVRSFERGAIYAGRAECWRVGTLPTGHYAYIDFEHAFASVCTLPLPWRRGAARHDLSLEHRGLSVSRVVELGAECEVETTTPRYPLRTPAGIVHPVGRFTTTLAGPELKEAASRGELRALGRGHVYAVSEHMEPWARWAIDVIDSPDDAIPDVARIAVKGWTRTVPGRWAGRTSRTQLTLEQPVPGWRLEHGRHHPGGAGCSTLDMAGKRYTVVNDVDMDQAFPAVLAWIQSYQRLHLGRLIDLVGVGSLVLCNTDGLVVDLEAFTELHDPYADRFLGPQGRLQLLQAHLDGWAGQLAPLTPRLKWVSRTLEVLSPQHMITDDARQLSGVPRSADRMCSVVDCGRVLDNTLCCPVHGVQPRHAYAFTDWPRLSTQLERGWEGGYTRRHRTVDLSDVPTLRWVLEDGSTRPVEASGRLGTPTRLLPPPNGVAGREGPFLRREQHPALRRLAAVV
jgi:hypothetical protein